MTSTSQLLARRFNDAMAGIYDQALALPNPYKASKFRNLVARLGGKAAADYLLDKQDTSYGFGELALRGREALKLSVEYLILQDPWRALFDPTQLQIARDRLKDVECPCPPEDTVWWHLDAIAAEYTVDADERNEPNANRLGAFKRGWRDAAERSERYTLETLSRLTWQNLGYRIGERFGSVGEDTIDGVFEALASRWNTQLEAASGQPTPDRDELQRRVDFLRKRMAADSVPPPGNRKPPKGRVGESVVHVRDPKVAAWVLAQAKGNCELCRLSAPFKTEKGEPYLEVHHAVPLAESGPDTADNCVALCPNCHRRCHHSGDRADATRMLYQLVDRLRAPVPST